MKSELWCLCRRECEVWVVIKVFCFVLLLLLYLYFPFWSMLVDGKFGSVIYCDGFLWVKLCHPGNMMMFMVLSYWSLVGYMGWLWRFYEKENVFDFFCFLSILRPWLFLWMRRMEILRKKDSEPLSVFLFFPFWCHSSVMKIGHKQDKMTRVLLILCMGFSLFLFFVLPWLLFGCPPNDMGEMLRVFKI